MLKLQMTSCKAQKIIVEILVRTSSVYEITEYFRDCLQLVQSHAHSRLEIDIKRKKKMVEQILAHFRQIAHHWYLKIISLSSDYIKYIACATSRHRRFIFEEGKEKKNLNDSSPEICQALRLTRFPKAKAIEEC